MIDNAKFGEFIRDLRKEKQMTQMSLAKKINISDKTVSKWEQGGLRYNSDKLKKAL